jgi:hypothetical protein
MGIRARNPTSHTTRLSQIKYCELAWNLPSCDAVEAKSVSISLRVVKTIIFGVAVSCSLMALAGCSRQALPKPIVSGVNQNDSEKALAQRYGCPVLGCPKSDCYSIQIQQMLATSNRFVAEGWLLDVAESHGSVEAVFDLPIMAGVGNKCIARLECPTNLVATLTSVQREGWCFVFDAGENSQDLIPSKDNDEPFAVESLLTIKGKLIDAVIW